MDSFDTRCYNPFAFVWLMKGLERVEPAEAFGNVLKRLRKEQGVTQEHLAQESGYHTTYISQIERGQKNPSLRTIFRVARVLGIRPHSMILSTEEEINKSTSD